MGSVRTYLVFVLCKQTGLNVLHTHCTVYFFFLVKNVLCNVLIINGNTTYSYSIRHCGMLFMQMLCLDVRFHRRHKYGVHRRVRPPLRRPLRELQRPAVPSSVERRTMQPRPTRQ